MQPRISQLALMAAAALLPLCLAGSGCGSRTNASFVPADKLARGSLDRALKTWQDGKSAGPIEPSAKGEPAIQVAESDWAAGKQLAAYEIMEELPPEGNTLRFQVRLTFTGPVYPVEVIYYVFGKNPIWISRDKDYSQMQSM